MYSSAYVWAKILGYLESKLSPTVVSTWFDDAEVVELTDQKLTICCPIEFRRKTIINRYGIYIRDAMMELFDTDVELVVLGEEEKDKFLQGSKQPDFIAFNPQFTFDTFVVGSSNRFAHGAALAVADNPAGAYNPLFIYGPSGLGKTHLLYAIASKIHKRNPDCNIVYIKGDQFTNELIEALRVGRNVEFRSKYRNADLFLVDDIQFIAGKDSTQEEFFHTFNTLYENHKQIVLTSDRAPSDIAKLEDRLKTRFEWGLLADIQPPDYETRMAIIKNKSVTLGMDMDDDVCSYIAENITTNVRQIEGTVKKIMAFRELGGMRMDVPSVSRAIKDMITSKEANTLPTPALIISEVSRFYSIEEQVLRGTRRDKATAEARQIAMYLMESLIHMKSTDIGKEFGRDHSTVLHSINKIKNLLRSPNSGLQDNIRDITSNINSRL